ncbi:MAG: T9SS type A sorting domain-containing protein [Bacteroidales bacterium]
MKKFTSLALTMGLIFFLCNFSYGQKKERNLVVLEIGTATWCGYCPGAAMGADDLVEKNKPVAIIENHTGDDFDNSYSKARHAFYGGGGIPKAVFDGKLEIVGGSASQSLYSNYLQKVNTRMNKLTSFSLEISGEKISDNSYKVVLKSEKWDEYDSDIRILLAVTESHIQKSWNGMTELNFVNRKMYPNANGEKVNFSSTTEEVEFIVDIDPSWNIEHLELVGIIQDFSSKEIMNGAKAKFNELTPSGPKVVANFSASGQVLCKPGAVYFENETKGDFLNIKWEFEGGEPATSIEDHPEVTYKEPGKYKVKLTVYNGDEYFIAEKKEYIKLSEKIVMEFTDGEFSLKDDAMELTLGKPLGGEYSGPGMLEDKKTFDPIKAGVGRHELLYTYINDVGCKGVKKGFVTVAEATGLAELENGVLLSISPNPAKDNFLVKIQAEEAFDAKMIISDLVGREVYTKDLNISDYDKPINVSTEGFKHGVYLLQIIGKETRIERKVVVM